MSIIKINNTYLAQATQGISVSFRLKGWKSPFSTDNNKNYSDLEKVLRENKTISDSVCVGNAQTVKTSLSANKEFKETSNQEVTKNLLSTGYKEITNNTGFFEKTRAQVEPFVTALHQMLVLYVAQNKNIEEKFFISAREKAIHLVHSYIYERENVLTRNEKFASLREDLKVSLAVRNFCQRNNRRYVISVRLLTTYTIVRKQALSSSFSKCEKKEKRVFISQSDYQYSLLLKKFLFEGYSEKKFITFADQLQMNLKAKFNLINSKDLVKAFKALPARGFWPVKMKKSLVSELSDEKRWAVIKQIHDFLLRSLQFLVIEGNYRFDKALGLMMRQLTFPWSPCELTWVGIYMFFLTCTTQFKACGYNSEIFFAQCSACQAKLFLDAREIACNGNYDLDFQKLLLEHLAMNVVANKNLNLLQPLQLIELRRAFYYFSKEVAFLSPFVAFINECSEKMSNNAKSMVPTRGVEASEFDKASALLKVGGENDAVLVLESCQKLKYDKWDVERDAQIILKYFSTRKLGFLNCGGEKERQQCIVRVCEVMLELNMYDTLMITEKNIMIFLASQIVDHIAVRNKTFSVEEKEKIFSSTIKNVKNDLHNFKGNKID